MKERQRGGIIVGQKVQETKVELAKKLRRKMTPEEKMLWTYLRTNKLSGFHFRRQQIIDGFIADFYCSHVRLVLEVDGGIHSEQLEYDAERDRIIAARNIRVLRIKNAEIKQNLPEVLEHILKSCNEYTPRH